MSLIQCWVLFFIFVKCTSGDNVFTNRFCDIRFTPTFIDKTPLIYEVFKQKYLYLNAPYKFGKSSNIGMLNMFLSNLRTKETIEEFFNGTEIWKDEDFVSTYAGDFPVILFNVSVHSVIHDEDHMKTTFRWTMHNTFLDHEYLLRSPSISRESRQVLERYLDFKQVQCLEIKMILKGVRFLGQMLYQHHKQKVILLADGFGGGIMERMLDDKNDLKYLAPKMVDWYVTIINNTFINQNIFSHAVFSGETWMYGMPQQSQALFDKVSFMEHKRISHFYGFTYDELEYLLCKYDIPLDQRPQVLKWYCGYSTVDGRVKVCNPQSILNYLHSPYKTIRVYWSGSVIGPDLLQRMAGVEHYGKHLINLVYNQPINITLDKNVTGGVDLLRIKFEETAPESEGFIYQLLVETGYLTYAGERPSGAVALIFPNEEIRSVVDKFVSLLSFI